MPSIKPITPTWQASGEIFRAHTALGEFAVQCTAPGYWIATLNDAPFPILYPSQIDAKAAARVVAALKSGFDAPMDWDENSLGGSSAQHFGATYHIAKSHAIEGFFVMLDDDPAFIPMSSAKEAQEACAQYISFVWFSLSEVTP